MKIKKVVFCCDENKNFIDFWNINSKICKEKLGFEPVLYFLGNSKNYDLSEKFGDVIQIDPVKDVPTVIQVLWAKFHFTMEYFSDDVCLLQDLDTIPLQKEWFENLNNLNEDEYAHLNADAYSHGCHWMENGVAGLPANYHVAKGSTIKKYLDYNEKFSEIVSEFYNSGKYGVINRGGSVAPEYLKISPHAGYYCCEEHYTTDIFRKKNNGWDIKGFTIPLGKRIDRINTPNIYNFSMEQLKNNFYIDLHCPRPFEEYKNEITSILENSDFLNSK